MKKHLVSLVAFTALVAVTLAAYAQPDGEKGKKGPPDGKKGYILGKILPPFIRDRLDLTDAQNEKIDALENDVKAKLEKILTAEQIRIAQEPMDKFGKGDKKGDKGDKFGKGDKKGDKGGKGDKKGGKGDKGPPDRPDMEEARAIPVSGIQWYATWESGLREAQRTNRPILLVSAAPHCAGVSGTW